MPQYTVSTDAAQEAALTAIVAKRNAEHAAQDPPITAAEYVAVIWASILASYAREVEADEDAKLREALKSPETRAAVKAAAKI